MARVRVHPEAAREVREIGHWWRMNTGRPRLFADEWKRAHQKLTTTPLIGPPCPRAPTLHRLLSSESQHYVYYRYEPPPRDVVFIISVWSNRRGEPPPLGR